MTNGESPWDRYELGDTVQQYQRISRTEAKHAASGLPVWIDKFQPYYGDHPDSLAMAREYLLGHCKVWHSALPSPVDAWEQEGALCWVYRPHRGTPLGDYVGEHRPALASIAPLLADLAQALGALHKAGLVHGSLDVDCVVVSGKRRLALTKRGIRHQLNDMLNRSTLETGLDRTQAGSQAEDIAAWGELLGVFLTGEAHFGRVVLSSRSTGSFEVHEAEEVFRRKGLAGRLPEVVLRAVKGRTKPEESFGGMDDAYAAFVNAAAHDGTGKGGLS